MAPSTDEAIRELFRLSCDLYITSATLENTSLPMDPECRAMMSLYDDLRRLHASLQGHTGYEVTVHAGTVYAEDPLEAINEVYTGSPSQGVTIRVDGDQLTGLEYYKRLDEKISAEKGSCEAKGNSCKG